MTLPSGKKAEKATKKKNQIEQSAQLSNDLKEVCSTQEGVRLLRHLMNACSYQSSGVVMDPVKLEINPLATTYNSIRRGVYIELRQFIPKGILKKIEIGG